MFGIGAPELVLILVIALVIFGPSKLPQIGASVGKSIREFKMAMREIDEPMPPPPAPKLETTQPTVAPTQAAQAPQA